MDKNIKDSILGYSQLVETPAYIVDERLLINNLETLRGVMDRTGARILLAQKAFSMFRVYPLIGEYLVGTTASGLFEAKLGWEEMKGKEVHVYSPAYREEEIKEILSICDHIVFNTPRQWKKYQKEVQLCQQNLNKKISCGLRINPEYAEIETDLYNPCIEGSRLGTVLENIKEEDLIGLEGLHFHTMCEQNSDVLFRTIQVIDKKFGKYLKNMKWINFGGGHHITKENYDIDTLERCIEFFQDKYQLKVYLEPGEAVALEAGFLVSKVLETMGDKIKVAILDTSAACHMPDVIEMPYRPEIIGAGNADEKNKTYRIGGPTCLAGDIVGDYSFDKPLKEGDRLVFCDMAIYSMVKNNTFNGMNLPNIYLFTKENKLEQIKKFNYNNFKERLS